MGVYENARNITRHKIRDTFWTLYCKEHQKKITVDQISAAAGVHRSTFYFHYKDIYEILEEIEKELLEDMDRIHIEETFKGNRLDELARQFYDVYHQKAEYLHILVVKRKRAEFASEYRHALENKMFSILETENHKKTILQKKVIEICISQMMEILIICADDPALNQEDMIEILKGFGTKGYYRTIVENFEVSDMFDPFLNL